MAPLASLRAEAVADWEPCGDQFYSLEHVYDMAWADVDLGAKRLCCAPSGGPIATMRDETAMVVVKGVGSTRPAVRLFNAAGVETGHFLWDGGALVGWGWSDAQELVMVDAAAKVSFYTLQGIKLVKDLTFPPEVTSEGVSAAVLYGDGLLLLTAATCQLWAIVGWDSRRPVHLAAVPGLTAAGAGPTGDGGHGAPALALLEPKYTLSRGLEVLVAVDETVWVVDDSSATDHPLTPGCGGVVSLAVSPDGAFVALQCGDGKLRVMASDFSRQLSEFDTHSGVLARGMSWCGVDAVVLQWEGLLLLVGPYGEHQRRPWEGPLVLVPEVDGVRLISSASHHLLRRVQDCWVQVYQPGSVAPAAQLWEARQLFDRGNARADRLLRDMGGHHLHQAVAACIEAAGLELSEPRQRALLRAAVLGRAFCSPSFPPLLLVDTCRKLRVLNALREPGVGLPLTMPQLQLITLPVVVARLVTARHHLLAYRISELLGVGGQAVLVAWAADKMAGGPTMSDAELKDAITAKLKLAPRPRFAAVAAHAQSLGRRSLAIKLLEEESSPGQQVPLLISLAKSSSSGISSSSGAPHTGADEEDDTLAKALRKAVESGDPDLVYLALFAGYTSRPLPLFWNMIAGRAPARNLFIKYAKTKDPELLDTLFTTAHLLPEGAELSMYRAQASMGPGNKQTTTTAGGGRSSSGATAGGGATGFNRPDDATINSFCTRVNQAAQKFDKARDSSFQSKAAAELALLVREQAKLEKDTGQALFLGLSLTDTLRACIRLGHNRAAAALRKQFSVPESRWYWLKLMSLCEAHDWEGLEEWAGERKASPIGWEPFLEKARQAGAPRDYLARLIARLPDTPRKAEEYASIDYAREAAEVAAKLRDGDLLARLSAAVSANSPAGLAIAQIRDRFQSTFR